MGIKYFFKRILKSTTFTLIGFFMANLILVLLISFMFWAGIISADPYCSGDVRRIKDVPCPPWSIEYTYTILSFEEVFIMCAGMYFGMIFIIIIAVILNNYRQTRVWY